MRTIISLALIFAFSFPPRSAQAWAESGHYLVAVLAFKLLAKEDQAKLLALLEQHPRYVEDFSPPEHLPNEEEKLLWRVGRTGYWSDVIRMNTTYDRPTWHYELGAALVLGNPARLKVPQRPGPLPPEATLETQTLYISQAIPLCQQSLANEHLPASERAVAICWLAHLVGDAHQPCHAGGLYMEGVFTEEDGDRGANRILTKQVGNMHALWDQLLGNEFKLNSTRQRLTELRKDAELLTRGEKAVSMNAGLDPQTWLAESRLLATEHVYTPDVIRSLEKVSRGLINEPEVIDLPPAYLENAGRVAKIRITMAAHRLAAVWHECINPEGVQSNSQLGSIINR